MMTPTKIAANPASTAEGWNHAADHILDHKARDPGPSIDGGEDEQRLKQDSEVIPKPHEDFASQDT
jgi:hypothetical protein